MAGKEPRDSQASLVLRDAQQIYESCLVTIWVIQSLTQYLFQWKIYIFFNDYSFLITKNIIFSQSMAIVLLFKFHLLLGQGWLTKLDQGRFGIDF